MSEKGLVRETSVRESDCPGNVCKAFGTAVTRSAAGKVTAVTDVVTGLALQNGIQCTYAYTGATIESDLLFYS